MIGTHTLGHGDFPERNLVEMNPAAGGQLVDDKEQDRAIGILRCPDDSVHMHPIVEQGHLPLEAVARPLIVFIHPVQAQTQLGAVLGFGYDFGLGLEIVFERPKRSVPNSSTAAWA